jgi:hypothetical protein
MSGDPGIISSSDPRTSVEGFAACATALTVGIILLLGHERADIAHPFAIPVYSHLVLFQDYYAAFLFVAVLVAALLPAFRRLAERCALWLGHNPLAAAAAAAAALAVGTHAVYHAHPLAADEYTVLFQSRVFADGRLAGHFPPPLLDWLVPPFFQGRFFQLSPATGDIASAYWPGFSLLLTPFTALGVPWLLNPLIGAATLLAVHRLALRLFGSAQAAGYAMLLTLASPAVTINAVSYYSMPAHLLLNALFMLLLLERRPLRALAAGAVGSLALVLHNPFPHALFALPWLVWLGAHRDRVRLLGALLAGYLPLAVVLGLGWPVFLQSISSGMPLEALATPRGAAGALLERISSVREWRSSTGPLAHLLDLCKLWLWATPGLVAAAAVGLWRARLEPTWRVIASCALLTYFGYFLGQFDQGHGWGFRYFHSAWLTLPLLAVAAFPPGNRLLAYLGACALLSLAVLTGVRAFQAERFIARQLAQLPAAAATPQAVFVDIRQGYYAWDLVQNDPYLRGPKTIFVSHGARSDAALMREWFPQYRLLSQAPNGSVWAPASR